MYFLPFRFLIWMLILMTSSTLVLAQQSSTRSSSSSVEITGQVRQANGGAPADNVLVRLEASGGGLVGQEMTDRLGKFRFSGLTPAQYIVTAHAPGFVDVRQQVDLQTALRSYLQFQLVAEKRTATTTSSGPNFVIDAKIPAEAQSEFDLGRAELLEQKKLDSGITHLEKAIKLFPDFAEAHLLLGMALMDNKQLEKAERELRRTEEINPKLAAAQFTLGEVYRRQKKYEAAEKVLQEGLKTEPRSSQGHLNLGRVYYDNGDLAKAGPEVGQAIQIKPDFAEAYVLAGNLFLKARKAESAVQMFEEYLRLEPSGQFAAETRELVAKIKRALAEKKQ
jgi:tetratricopeptide (TPR) repeat protein